MELWFLFSAHCLIVFYICTKFNENISKGFKVIEGTQFPRGIMSKNVGGAMVLVLCSSPDNALYLYQIL